MCALFDRQKKNYSDVDNDIPTVKAEPIEPYNYSGFGSVDYVDSFDIDKNPVKRHNSFVKNKPVKVNNAYSHKAERDDPFDESFINQSYYPKYSHIPGQAVTSHYAGADWKNFPRHTNLRGKNMNNANFSPNYRQGLTSYPQNSRVQNLRTTLPHTNGPSGAQVPGQVNQGGAIARQAAPQYQVPYGPYAPGIAPAMVQPAIYPQMYQPAFPVITPVAAVAPAYVMPPVQIAPAYPPIMGPAYPAAYPAYPGYPAACPPPVAPAPAYPGVCPAEYQARHADPYGEVSDYCPLHEKPRPRGKYQKADPKHADEYQESVTYAKEPIQENEAHVDEPVNENVQHEDEHIQEIEPHVEEPVDENADNKPTLDIPPLSTPFSKASAAIAAKAAKEAKELNEAKLRKAKAAKKAKEAKEEKLRAAKAAKKAKEAKEEKLRAEKAAKKAKEAKEEELREAKAAKKAKEAKEEELREAKAAKKLASEKFEPKLEDIPYIDDTEDEVESVSDKRAKEYQASMDEGLNLEFGEKDKLHRVVKHKVNQGSVIKEDEESTKSKKAKGTKKKQKFWPIKVKAKGDGSDMNIDIKGDPKKPRPFNKKKKDDQFDKVDFGLNDYLFVNDPNDSGKIKSKKDKEAADLEKLKFEGDKKISTGKKGVVNDESAAKDKSLDDKPAAKDDIKDEKPVKEPQKPKKPQLELDIDNQSERDAEIDKEIEMILGLNDSSSDQLVPRAQIEKDISEKKTNDVEPKQEIATKKDTGQDNLEKENLGSTNKLNFFDNPAKPAKTDDRVSPKAAHEAAPAEHAGHTNTPESIFHTEPAQPAQEAYGAGEHEVHGAVNPEAHGAAEQGAHGAVKPEAQGAGEQGAHGVVNPEAHGKSKPKEAVTPAAPEMQGAGNVAAQASTPVAPETQGAGNVAAQASTPVVPETQQTYNGALHPATPETQQAQNDGEELKSVGLKQSSESSENAVKGIKVLGGKPKKLFKRKKADKQTDKIKKQAKAKLSRPKKGVVAPENEGFDKKAVQEQINRQQVENNKSAFEKMNMQPEDTPSQNGPNPQDPSTNAQFNYGQNGPQGSVSQEAPVQNPFILAANAAKAQAQRDKLGNSGAILNAETRKEMNAMNGVDDRHFQPLSQKPNPNNVVVQNGAQPQQNAQPISMGNVKSPNLKKKSPLSIR